MFSMKPGNYVLGSPQSRAAARSLLSKREASEVDEPQRSLQGLAEHIRVARMRLQGSELPVSLAARETRQRSNGGGSPACLSERIKKARERARGALKIRFKLIRSGDE